MSTSPLNYERSVSANIPNFPNAKSWHRVVSGIKATGLDRSRPQPVVITEGKALSWRTLKSNGNTAGSPTSPTERSAHESKFLPFGGGFPGAVNNSYSKMVDKLHGETSAIGVAAGEWRQSFGMIANRATSIYRAYKSLRKGDLNGFLTALQIRQSHRRPPRGWRTVTGDISGVRLEYAFGWKPLVQDIYNSCIQLSEPLPSNEIVFGRSGDYYERQYGTTNAQRIGYAFRVEQGASFSLVNPNLYLAGQLGLVNPATIGWELIPGSFIADWLFDVSSFIGSFSDFIGLAVNNPYTSQTVFCNWSAFNTTGMDGVYHAKQVFMTRRLGLTRPFPNTDVFVNLGHSVGRAANAVSLVGQLLKKT